MRAEDARDRAELPAQLDRRDEEIKAARRKIADLTAELEETNRGLIALLAELDEARRAEARLAAIVQSSDDAMFSVTSDGVVQTWNHGAERLFGYREYDVIGRSAAALLPDESRAAFDEALERIRAGGRAEPYDTKARRADGSLVDVAVTLSAMRDPDGALTGFSVVLRDISERLRTEAELAAARAAHEVMADRDRIARDLHDMVIQRVFGAGLALQATAGMIAQQPQAVARLQSVIAELDVTIGELRTAIFDLHLPPPQAVSLRAQLLELTSTAAEGLGFPPSIAFDGPVDSAVPDDIGVHLLAVVREALSNVAKHAGASAAEVTISVGDELIVRISDDGRGLGPGTRRSGLRNMRERAESLGGAFEVTSPPGAGTRLEWRVPLP